MWLLVMIMNLFCVIFLVSIMVVVGDMLVICIRLSWLLGLSWVSIWLNVWVCCVCISIVSFRVGCWWLIMWYSLRLFRWV